MKFNSSAWDLWQKTPSGALVPGGRVHDSLGHDTTHLPVLKERAQAVRELFVKNGVTINPASALYIVLADIDKVTDAWLIQADAKVSGIVQLEVTRFGGCIEHILALSGHPNAASYLERLAAGDIKSLVRGPSDARSILWELELWHNFRRRGVSASLVDPPDIVLEGGDSEVAVACKMLFSEGHVQNVLSKGVNQIARFGTAGLLAINIDDLTVHDQVYTGRNHKEITEILNNINMTFLSRHERHFRKYLDDGRICGALVSSACLARLEHERVKLNYVRMTTVWSLETRNPDQDRNLRCVMRCLK